MTLSSKRRSPGSRYRDKLRVVPTFRLAGWLAAGAPVAGLAYAANPELGLLAIIAWNGTLAAFSAADLWSLPAASAVRVRRDAPEKVDLGRPFESAVSVTIDGARLPRRGTLLDDLPDTFDAEAGTAPRPLAFDGAEAAVRYDVLPRERGRYALHAVFVRLRGALGLWERQAHVPCESEVRVLPDLSGVRGMLASLQRTLVLDGKRVYRRASAGTELQGIRDYTPDDDPRAINWSATARALQTKVNVFQPERGKIVTLLIDCGRMMGVELEGQTKLDRSLEAALTMAAVALQRGDQVAALAFSGRLSTYVPPGKGVAHLQTLIDAVYDLKSDTAESNYALALAHLARVQKKRSLIVLFTDMENVLFETELVPYLIRLRRTHPVLLLCLQDPVLREWSRIGVTRLKDAYVKSAAYKFMEDRRAFAARMAALGIEALDVPANELALAAVNAYLEMKSRDAL
ncbi:DUF58 domain-containing protein [Paenibacillus antri]|uniref:DUF58 domain-containing protein n=1 Tax=Paenibacillus antri TaxID=2582848 RepID=A0A5R9G9F2_9BACL|nr:DUF58 domain-containing protein [Paenibacillus antri]TLS49704.1 DUF58 domain-containing protein [Paenibacillus antri]